MTIEDTLTRIAEAIEALVAQRFNDTDTPIQYTPPQKPKPTEPTPSTEAVAEVAKSAEKKVAKKKVAKKKVIAVAPAEAEDISDAVMRDAALRVLRMGCKPMIADIISPLGVERVTMVPQPNRAAVLTALNAIQE